MDAKQLFRSVSDKMRNEFEMSAHFAHFGTRGTAREDTLREFLAKGRLPAKYGLGSGEVVGHVRDVSRQCDIVIYDSMYGLSLHYAENSQIYPIDCVYGVIEVKSGLSKTELIDSLEKIKAFKEITMGSAITQPIGNGFTMVRARPKPFGVVFAYSLSGNSLDSLCQNLEDWESKNPPTSWPNYICVLGEGCISHQSGFDNCIDSETITAASIPIALKHESDSLFKFYCAVHDMCSRMNLGPVELGRYFDPGVKIGRFSVFGRAIEAQLTIDGNASVSARLKESTLEKIVAWCAKTEKIRHSDLLKKRFGALPAGVSENSAAMATLIYLYNPDNFPGIDDLRANPPTNMEDTPEPHETLLQMFELVIDGNCYALPIGSLPPSEWDIIE
ncbi:DUF6602 domain-containing protein [Burkholderia sp. Ac-20353]|uniref:DUF6602 domain-containing protein n=1 Tax=Burkholderia sp. Ac-20353 TaxID=2703894 RepID=UPI00197B87B1|nr:DUF6602 domain-containing protein [Burkholderia sp. Ac-20353]MBN3791860.1 hypothetical protein [Burkholderia sp. Ac-20353]